MSANYVRLGVNIDHVATIRNARGGPHPDPVRAAHIAEEAGADGITAHLREDRRHIGDNDITRLSKDIGLPLNLEMAATEEMLAIALNHRPHACCLVPEKREERTTEGGLDIAAQHRHVAPFVEKLKSAGIRVSLFIEPDPVQIAVAEAMGADIVELHTGAYCEAFAEGDRARVDRHLDRLREASREGHGRGLEIHAGHGLTFDTVKPVAAMAEVRELNIGHFLMGEALFVGLRPAVEKMRALIAEARSEAAA
ncbi:pyridoxine 5'-phosphate synthase [Hyphobacterium marinum]|uniref:Pyridoxine 5'-phosphate synthase n=1 Tax=Hyphobacterium marinum TaxID=3116574 RepID=A0ABU7LZV7_9PROT|nr:pyridoxine 5'-phosphate synthase [Hyphobacterium sp. Y6023]MEE2566710.1 pyridoxine 5'-phosphate synthase [Hyphobacterium sp. Y6023]